MTQTFINDLINTNQPTFLTALKVLLVQNELEDNIFDVITLLDTYNIPESNINNLVDSYLLDNDFDISSYDTKDTY